MAPIDSQKPTDHTNIGSTSTSSVTVHASSRATAVCRPSTYDELASIAMTPARSTDGSKRVRTMNQPIRARVAAQRDHGRSRRSSGEAAAIKNATFSPDTAVRCDSPDVRNASTISAGWRASSPITRPVNRLASGTPIADSAARRSACAHETTCGTTASRRASHRRPAARIDRRRAGAVLGEPAMWSPVVGHRRTRARRPDVRRAAGSDEPYAQASKRSPWISTVTRSPLPKGAGSPTTTTQPA